ncbi:class I SAM-dependent methyltransferase [Blastococcus tunisiensis]|uniref:Methyltransferase domain-containing protein n=1 Tax=Blastococcus tunisiensis TaxID=1798228 RepID=A0A1I2I325_9ACTN|nr:class I SAM-dependent methyltransferase [Blastococcus sp. DSM 46838]SFF36765.1 Methyltransferase domain-containing protein [Blastococcus sp. DSM 46838]
MRRLITARALWTLARAGNLPARVRANREGATAIRLHLAGAAVDTGLLDALATGAADIDELAQRMAVDDLELLAAFLRVVESASLVQVRRGSWRLTARGRAIVDDDLVRAVYQAFPGFHTGLYRELPAQLAGGRPRRDVAEQGGLIARVSAAFEPFVLSELTATVVERAPRRVLDIGCGAGLQLAAMLDAAPAAEGVGIDSDADAAALAGKTLRDRGLDGRSHLRCADVREVLADRTGALADPFDLAVLANVIYYVPMGDRVALLRDIASLLAPGGVLFLVTSVATRQLFSRHFDLLLHAQDGAMELTDADALLGQLTAAGLRPSAPRPIAPGAPVVTVRAVWPG